MKCVKKQWLSGCDAVILECIYCLCLAKLSKSSGNVFKFCITISLTLIKPSFGMTALINEHSTIIDVRDRKRLGIRIGFIAQTVYIVSMYSQKQTARSVQTRDAHTLSLGEPYLKLYIGP